MPPKSSQLFESFTEQQRAFVDKKTLSTTLKVKQWKGFLKKVSAYDQLADEQIKSLGKTIQISLIVAVVFVFLSFMITPFLLLISLGLGGFGFFKMKERSDLKKRDVNNYLRLFFMPVVDALESKAGSDARLSATLDFRNPTKALTPEKSKVNGRNLSLYQPTYIIAKVTLLDKTQLEFVVKDDIKDFRWTKRSASGKTKFKRKCKTVHHILLKMTLSKDEYKWLGQTKSDTSVSDVVGAYLVKHRVKMKMGGGNLTMNVKSFFVAMQKVYDQFEPLNPRATRRDDDGDEAEYDDDMDTAMAVGAYVWFDSSFDNYDYDSFDYSDNDQVMMDDEGATVFDS